MAAARTDYYEVLGVPRDADEETIRRAFQAAARDVHPDASDAPDAERRFRELAEAYSVLSKPGSRLLYDRFGYRARGNTGFDEALSETRGPVERGKNVRTEVILRVFEAEQGVSRVVRYDVAERCTRCEGRGTTADGGLCEQCDGTGIARGERALKVGIPSGTRDGSQLRVAGEGDAARSSYGLPGDLLIDVKVMPEPTDARAVRYAALALFLLAVALLVAYVLLR